MDTNRIPQFPATVRRHVGQAYHAMLKRDYTAAAHYFNEAHLECLIRASQAPAPTVPPPGSMAADYMDLANRATDPGARAHWQQLAEDELEEARRNA